MPSIIVSFGDWEKNLRFYLPAQKLRQAGAKTLVLIFTIFQDSRGPGGKDSSRGIVEFSTTP